MTKRYRVTQDYRSGVGAWAAGDEIDLEDDVADFLGRDAPGTLELIPGTLEFVPETRAPEKPPADRMVKSAARRGAL